MAHEEEMIMITLSDVRIVTAAFAAGVGVAATLADRMAPGTYGSIILGVATIVACLIQLVLLLMGSGRINARRWLVIMVAVTLVRRAAIIVGQKCVPGHKL